MLTETPSNTAPWLDSILMVEKAQLPGFLGMLQIPRLSTDSGTSVNRQAMRRQQSTRAVNTPLCLAGPALGASDRQFFHGTTRWGDQGRQVPVTDSMIRAVVTIEPALHFLNPFNFVILIAIGHPYNGCRVFTQSRPKIASEY